MLVIKRLKHSIRGIIDNIEKRYYCIAAKYGQRKKLESLKGKERIKCVILQHISDNFREKLYELFVMNPRFEVYVVVSPDCGHGEVFMKDRLQSTYDYLITKGYKNIICGYDVERKVFFDIKKELNPDVLIYTNPYRSFIGEHNFPTNFIDVLTVYIPYYINNTIEYDNAYNELLHNLVWRYYIETEWHKKLSIRYSTVHGRNTVVTGYSGIDSFIDETYLPKDDYWKIKNNSVKKIVWAPHQTINPSKKMYYSAFLLICDQMVELALKYKDQIQIAFKPHPLLINSLYKTWGKEKTDAYYKKWMEMDNTCIVEGSYVDLFLTSDAIIHDSASFITEYLYINKPALRTHNGRDLRTLFNDFSLACLEHYYNATTAEEIEQFILNVINGVDSKEEGRTAFINDVLIPKSKHLPSENIVNDILDSIDNQILYRN